MEVGKLSVEYRPTTGKSVSRRLRKAGLVPAICYGAGADPLSLAVNPTLLLKALDPVKKMNTVIELTVDGAPSGAQTLTVMVRDYQRDVLRGDLTHADFVRVKLDQDVHAEVPVVLIGKAPGVKEGGLMHHGIHRLEIACRPHLIPAKIEVDISGLNMGDAIHVGELKLGEGIRALADAKASVCSVTAPRAEKVEEVAAVPVEGAAAAPGAAPAAAGAAAAAPAAAGGKAAAPAAAGAAKPAAEKKK
jgi:large subunit ribosomal protein L25